MRLVDELLPPALRSVSLHIGQAKRLDVDAILQRAAEPEIVDDVITLQAQQIVRESLPALGADEFSSLTHFPKTM